MKHVTEAQWVEAESFFDADSTLTFLPKNRSKLPEGHSAKNSENAENSFIKIGDTIYALASAKKEPGKAVAGTGVYGRVKYAVDRENRRCLFKIINTYGTRTVEGETLQALNLSTGHTFKTRLDGVKCYIQMSYLGKSYAGADFSQDERLRLGIEACLKVASLHEKGYAHLDIKPDNFTVDAQGGLHLVDFGLAVRNPDHPRSSDRRYFQAYSCPGPRCTGRQADIYALKKVLHYWSDGNVQSDDERSFRRDSVLRGELPDGFSQILRSNEYKNITPETLAALLINLRYQLGYEPGQLAVPNSAKTNPLSAGIVDAWKKGIHPKMYACYLSVLEEESRRPPEDNDEGELPSDRRSQLLHEGFVSVLRNLEAKANLLEGQSPEAAKAIRSIVHSARAFEGHAPLSNIGLQTFKSSMQDVIDDVRPTLETHRGILGKVDTLLTIMASLVVFYPAVWAYQKYHNIGHTFINTRSGKMLKELEDVKNTLGNPSAPG